jgi:PST family polysaccharide transporter
MNRDKSVLSGIGMMALLTVCSKLVRLIVLMITARFLMPEDFGIVATFSMILALGYLIADIGVMKTIIQRPVINSAHIGGAIAISTVFSILVFIILISCSEYIENITGVSGVKLPLQVSSFIFLLFSASNVCSALYQRNGQIVLIGKIQSFATIFGNVFVTVPLLWFDIGLGYWSLIIGILTTEIISLSFILWWGRKSLKFYLSKSESYEIIKYSSAFLTHNLIKLISKQIDIALIGRYLGKSDLGNYSRTMQLIEFPSQIYWLVVDRVVFPNMSAMKSDKCKLNLFFTDFFSSLLLILYIGATILYFGSNELVTILMGEGWGIVVSLLKILAVSIVFKCLTGFIDSFIAAHGIIKQLTYKNFISLVIFILSIFIGIKNGMTGVAYAVDIANGINFLMSIIIVLKYTDITIEKIASASMPTFFTVSFLVIMFNVISNFTHPPDLISIIIATMLWIFFNYLYPSRFFLSGKIRDVLLKIKHKELN